MATANGICCENIASALIDNGYNVNIVAYAYNEKTYENIRGVNVYYAKCPCRALSGIAYKLYFYAKWMFKFSKYPITEIKKRTDAIFELSSRVVEEKNIDTVICVHLPIETLIAGVKLKEKYPNLNCISYMLDSLSGGFTPGLLPERFCRLRKIKWENNLLSRFDCAVLMEASRPHHEAKCKRLLWYKNAIYLDIPLLKVNDTDSHKKAKDKATVAFCGLLDFPARNVPLLLNVIEVQENSDIEYVLVGSSNISDKLKNNSPANVRYMGFLPHKSIADILLEADIFLNLGVTVPSAISGKIFEYMSYGKPIISTYSIDNEACLPYLKKYPCALLIDEREKDIKNQAKKLEEFIIKNKDTRVNVNKIEEIFYNNTPKAFVRALEKRFGENI